MELQIENVIHAKEDMMQADNRFMELLQDVLDPKTLEIKKELGNFLSPSDVLQVDMIVKLKRLQNDKRVHKKK